MALATTRQEEESHLIQAQPIVWSRQWPALAQEPAAPCASVKTTQRCIFMCLINENHFDLSDSKGGRETEFRCYILGHVPTICHNGVTIPP